MDTDLPLLAKQALGDIEELIGDSIKYGHMVMDARADEVDEALAQQSLQRACVRAIVLLEQFGDRHSTLLAEARRILESVKADPMKTQLVEGEAYLVLPYEIREVVDTVRSLHFEKEEEAVQEIAPLLDVISRLEYYITDPQIFGTMPGREGDVHERIEGVLKCLYPDVQGKRRLPKRIKGFEPDTTIPCLRTLVEYKFITSKVEGRKVVDEILADIGGYQTDDFDRFVFVIYETRRLFHVDDWIKTIEASKPGNTVEVVVLKGGSLVRKAPKKKPKAE